MELIERDVEVAGRTLSLLVPADPDALATEEAYGEDEFLPYWAELWPSGLALAEAVAGNPSPPTRVLELGCGLGIPSLVAALAGATVVATDWSDDAIALLRSNAARVGTEVDARVWSWNDDPAGLSAELVIAADVLYEARNGPLMLRALDAVVAPGGAALIADPGRAEAPAFFESASAGWDVEPLGGSLWRLTRATSSA